MSPQHTRLLVAALLIAGMAAVIVAIVVRSGDTPQPTAAVPATPTSIATARAATPILTPPPPSTSSATPTPDLIATPAATPTPSATTTPTATPLPALLTPTPASTSTPTPRRPPATFHYDTYDTAGAVATAGSYAFMVDTNDPASVATTHGWLLDATGILVNVADAAGTSRAAHYDAIEPGDVLEWLPSADGRCWQRYRVTAVLPDPAGSSSRKLFSLEHLPEFVLWCHGPLVAERSALATELRWNPPSARPDRDGIPVMLWDQAVEGGRTYRPSPNTTLVIDVPARMTLVRDSRHVLAGGHVILELRDVDTGSSLVLDLWTGEELGRRIQTSEGESRDVGALFDQIVASARISPAPVAPRP